MDTNVRFVWERHIRDREDLKAPARRTAMVLATYMNETGSCYPSQATIAKAAGVSPRQVRYDIKDLVTAGALRIEYRGQHYTPVYHARFQVQGGSQGGSDALSAQPQGGSRTPQGGSQGGSVLPTNIGTSSRLTVLCRVCHKKAGTVKREQLSQHERESMVVTATGVVLPSTRCDACSTR